MDREVERGKFKPQQVRFLFIAESPPSALERFFYVFPVREKDGLFVETMKVLYGTSDVTKLRKEKERYLRMFRDDGFFLVDAMNDPIPQKTSLPKKKRMVREALCSLEAKLQNFSRRDEPKIILISASVFEIAEPLKNDGFNVINTEMIDFPAFSRQKLFRDKLSRLLEAHGGIPSRDYS